MPLRNLKKPKRYDLTIVTGDSFELILRLREKVNGVQTPIPLAGYEVAAQIRDAPRQRLVVAFAASITDEADGEVTLSLTTTETLLLTANATWDLQFRLTASPATDTHTVLYGTVNTHLDDTKPT